VLFSSFNIFGKRVGPYDKFKKIIYSQTGEEGIIEFLLKKILKNFKNLNVCEFGAWNGVHLSNTFYFVKKFKANALYIEKSKEKFEDLIQTTLKYPSIKAINTTVSRYYNHKNSLDKLLNKYLDKKNLDVLSIDIDSYDLDVWESLKNFSPKIVIIEINSELGKDIKRRHGDKNCRGNSFLSTIEVAKKKNYQLISHMGNCIFIKNNYLKKLNFNKKFINNPTLLYNDYWIKINKFLYYFEYLINFFLKNIKQFIYKIRLE
jgi:hypothetical protein